MWRVAGPLAIALSALSSVGALGCSGHESRLYAAHDALDRGAPDEAVAALGEELEVASEADLPVALEGDDALLVLDRGTIQLWRRQWELANRDLSTADKAIDLLDMSRGAVDDLGKYLFSDDVGPYRAPAYEKLMINTLGMVGFLERRDLEGAKVEARRLAIVQKYLADREDDTTMLGLGSYLAGFVFEKAGSRDEALLYYEEALARGSYGSLRDPIRWLTGGAPSSPRMRELVGDAGAATEIDPAGTSELLVVVGYGRVPQKVPKRIPIGLALTLVSGHLSPHDHARANELALKGLVSWVSYPSLGPSRGSYARPVVTVNGQPLPLEEGLDVEDEVRRAFEAQEGTIVASAVTRLIARVAAGEVVHAVGRGSGKNGGLVGLLAGLATTATLSALDTPDTRSWSTLPSKIALARVRIPAGSHRVRLEARGARRELTVDAKPGGWSFASLMALR
jgi:hypothetical protein